MRARLARFGWGFCAFAVVLLCSPHYLAMQSATASPTSPYIRNHVTQLTGLLPEEISEIYAAEQLADIVLIPYEFVIPIVREPRVAYLLVRIAATGEWIRVIVNAAEWDQNFRPFFQANGIPVAKQRFRTIDTASPSEEAAQIAVTSSLSGVTIANLSLYGNPSGPGGSSGPAAVPAPHVEPDPGAGSALASDRIGTTVGSFRVDESGAATYSIPIAAAEGTAGVAPQVALSYSSTAGNGIAGMGWSVAGLSAVSRCRATYGQDLSPSAITWTNADQFCLDGRRLLRVSGTHGSANAVYRAEIDDGSVTTVIGTANGGPDYFKVERSDGSVSYYGKSPNSTNTSAKLSNSAGQTMSWALRHFTDSVGNPIWFEYENTGAAQRISNIKYAYGATKTNPAASHGARIEFAYEPRPDPTSGYVAGSEFSNDQRLSGINVYNTQGAEQLVREYLLAYGEDHNVVEDNLSRLTSIQECLNGTCLPPTEFDWRLPAQSPYFSFSTGFTMVNSNHGLLDYQTGDLDGDGRLDLVWMEGSYGSNPSNMNPRLNYAMSTGTGFSQKTFIGGGLEVVYPKVSSYVKTKLEVFDYNIDGRQDVALYDYAAQQWKVHLSVPQPDGSWRLKASPISIPISTSAAKFIDVNADGLADAVHVQPSGIRVSYLQKSTEPLSSDHYYRYSAWQDWTSTDPGFLTSRAVLATWDPLEIQSANADFNGDGRVDFLLTGIVGIGCNSLFCFPTAEIVAAFVTNGDGTFSPYYTFSDEDINIQHKRIRAVDLNSDGLTDVIYARGNIPNPTTNFWYRLNRGDGTFTAPVALNEANLGQEATGYLGGVDDPQLIDWNMDGYPDVMWKQVNGGTGIRVRYWNPETQVYEPSRYLTWAYSSDKEFATYPDMDGDGVPQILKVNNQNGQGVVSTVTRTAGLELANRAVNRIEAVTNGLGARMSVNYEALSTTDHYERLVVGTTTATGTFCEREPGFEFCFDLPYQVADAAAFYTKLNGGWELPAGTQTLGKSRPVLELQAPVYVVTEMQGDAPAAGPSPGAVDTTAQSVIEYYYGEGKIQASGRGFLGFQRLKTVDRQSGVETTTTYRQDWPFIGSPLKTEIRSASGHLLSKSTNDWKVIEYTNGLATNTSALAAAAATAENSGTAALGPIHRVLSVAQAFNYELKNNGVDEGSLLSQTETSTTYYPEGNADVSTVVSKNGSGTTLKTVTTNSDYFATAALPVRLGRLSQTSVTTTRPEEPQPQTLLSRFTYYTSGSLKGLLRTETIEPNRADLKLVTTHSYDAFGNIVRSSLTGGNQTRCNADIGKYDASGRYLDVTYDCLGRKIAEVTARNKLGAPTSTRTFVDAGGASVTGQASYGALGREYFRREPNGAFIKTYLTAFTTDCPAGTAHKSLSTKSGGKEVQQCFDRLGRVTRTLTRGFDGGLDAQDNEFDAFGRLVFKSEPYSLPAGPQLWTRFDYDLLGRTVATTLPDNSLTTIEFDGLQKTIRNDENQVKTEVMNALGEITDVYDNLGGRTRYQYDHEGRMTRIIDNAGNTTIVEFDLLGRKKSSVDPDSGYWTYDYNQFGELEVETNANGHSSTMTYDALGRMKTRVDTCATSTTGDCAPGTLTEGSTVWTYDSAPNGLGQVATVHDTISGYLRVINYDSLGRTAQVTTNFDGTSYYEKTTYDRYGRMFQVFDAAGNGTFQDSGIQYTYNAYGYLQSIADAILIGGVPRTVYRTINSMNARGQVTEETLGNGVTTTNEYYEPTGRAKKIYSSGNFGEVQDLRYGWDTIGNLEYRYEYSGTKTLQESFTYDGLNRLKTQQVAGQAVTNVTYDPQHLGNIKSKTGVGTYTYGAGSAGPHAVTQAGSVTYQYDANGNNVSSSDGRQIDYTTFNKPYEIRKGGHTTSFAYGPERARYKRIDNDSNGTTITRYIGAVELITRPDYTQEKKRYIAGIAIETTRLDISSTIVSKQTHYTHKDHLGSLDVLTDSAGQVVQELSFDAWGQRRNASNWASMSAVQLMDFDSSLTTRGFTGHEMLDQVGLIHMNGRIYDAKLGRFLQADPFVSDGFNSQALNRYSYVLNNPLNATDPSGYLAFIPALIGIASSILGGAIAVKISIGIGVAIAAVGNAIATLIAGGSLGDALLAGVSAAALTALGADFLRSGASFGFNVESVALVASVSLVSGVTSVLQDGKFGNGFSSAAIGAFVGGVLKVPVTWKSGTQLAVKSIIGGTLSKITGGKFANGAITAAMGHVLGAGIIKGVDKYLNEEVKLYWISGDIDEATGEFTRLEVDAIDRERLFINGILNDLDSSINAGLEQTGGQGFILAHNPTHGFVADLVESALGKYMGPSSFARQLATLMQGSAVTQVIAHSQGSIIATNAFDILAKAEYKFAQQVEVTFNGGAANYRAAGEILTQVNAELQPISSSNVHFFDAVPNVIGFNTYNPFKFIGSVVASPLLFAGFGGFRSLSPHSIYEP